MEEIGPPLSVRQEAFCQEYIVDFNGTQAAIRAGYSDTEAARVQASRMLARDNISSRINQLIAERKHRVSVTADFVLQSLLRIVNVDLSDAFDEEGNMLSIKKMPKDLRLALASYEESYSEHGMNRKLKPNDRMKALELIGRHVKMFTDKLEHTGNLTLEDLVVKSNKEN